jgi:hypothetical protein
MHISLCVTQLSQPLDNNTMSNHNDDDDNNNQSKQLSSSCIYEHDMLLNNQSKRNIQHHLASLAIQDILSKCTTTTIKKGIQWTDLKFNEISAALKVERNKQKQQQKDFVLDNNNNNTITNTKSKVNIDSNVC